MLDIPEDMTEIIYNLEISTVTTYARLFMEAFDVFRDLIKDFS